MQLVAAWAFLQRAGEPDLAGVVCLGPRRMDCHHITRRAVARGVDHQGVEAFVAVEDLTEDSRPQPPAAAERGPAEQAHRIRAVFPGGPSLALEMIRNPG